MGGGMMSRTGPDLRRLRAGKLADGGGGRRLGRTKMGNTRQGREKATAMRNLSRIARCQVSPSPSTECESAGEFNFGNVLLDLILTKATSDPGSILLCSVIQHSLLCSVLLFSLIHQFL